MTPAAYYNELDPSAAAWLRQLIKAGHIAAGDVDERSITDVRPDDLRGYTQCHFFAGIGGWSYALRLAGFPDDRPIFTGSCPCQPFSAAGKQRGSDDERHLWPAFFDLIRECRPRVVVGEQVAGAAGYAWADHVGADVEGEGYAFAAADIGAHSVGAPHLRQRLYWVALANAASVRSGAPGEAGWIGAQRPNWTLGSGVADDLADPAPRGQRIDRGASRQAGHAAQCDATCGLADSNSAGRSLERQRGLLDGQRPALGDDTDRCGADGVGDAAGPRPQGRDEPGQRPDAQREAAERASAAGGMGDADGNDQHAQRESEDRQANVWAEPWRVQSGPRGPGPLAAWTDLEWIASSDGKARPAQRGIFPLAHGLPAGLVRGGDQRLAPDDTAEGRVMRLRGYGNAIVPQVAAAFVMAALEVPA